MMMMMKSLSSSPRHACAKVGDGLAEYAKKGGNDVAENYKQFDQLEKALTTCNVFDGWKGGGILSIGTFGYGPLLKHIDENINHVTSEKEQVIEVNNYDHESCHDYHITSDYSEDEDEDQEEVNPLVYAAYNNNYVHDDDDDDDDHDYEGLMETINPTTTTTVSPKDEMKKERITLAELFYADSEEDQLQKKRQVATSHKPAAQISIKDKSSSSYSYKHGLSFAKKLIGDQDARPIHKLHRLIGRMLKRKIHPDADVDVEKHMMRCSTTPIIFTSTHPDCEFASLLSTHQAKWLKMFTPFRRLKSTIRNKIAGLSSLPRSPFLFLLLAGFGFCEKMQSCGAVLV
ncbi:hypothetical protein Sango_0227300 [Sesamum angolense]|uniref:Protein TILLER ANGLE CONTROL 1 n=1 Tax=Sesamum angolense TaxID=2727404 RepID=A0AAE2C773_9LAMI|nr:hypothetical protein Sango_0227300 [Sesamum angolense]